VCQLGLPPIVVDARPARFQAEDAVVLEPKWVQHRLVLAYLATGASLSDAARNAGVSVATALRWNRAFQRGGLASLMPPKPQVKPSPLDRLGIGPEIIRAVELIAVQLGNTVKAWRSFAASSRCPEHLRHLATADIPEALRAAVRFHVVPAVVMIGREWACLRLDLPEPSPCRPASTFGGPRHD
jgi:transposase-like protein